MPASQIEERTGAHIVPYYGRDSFVARSDPLFQATTSDLLKIVSELNKKATRNDALWKDLSSELETFANYMLHSDATISRYQLEIFAEAIIPYLRDIQVRIHVDKARFSQVTALLRLLRDQRRGNYSGSAMSGPTAASSAEGRSYQVLKRMEIIVAEVNAKGGFWKSKLGTLLEVAVKRQWEPIVDDLQRMLQSVGGKLLALGLVEVVGRPIIMLYPLFLVAKEVLRIASEFEAHKSISAVSIAQLMKMVVMLFAVMQISGILAMYSSLGYTCLFSGLAALVISSNDELTKHFVPILTPQIVQMEEFIGRIYRLEGMAMQSLTSPSSSSSSSFSFSASSSSLPSSSSSSSSSSSFPHSNTPPSINHRRAPTPTSTSTGTPPLSTFLQTMQGLASSALSAATAAAAASRSTTGSTSIPGSRDDFPLSTRVEELPPQQQSPQQSNVPHTATTHQSTSSSISTSTSTSASRTSSFVIAQATEVTAAPRGYYASTTTSRQQQNDVDSRDFDEGEYVFAEAVPIVDDDNYIDGSPAVAVGVPSSYADTNMTADGLRQRRR